MSPDRSKIVYGKKVEEFEWGGKMVVYIDDRLTAKKYDDINGVAPEPCPDYVPDTRTLAKYLADYIDTEVERNNGVYIDDDVLDWLTQGIEAFESTENVKINFERAK
jgi:hypothetical protein